MRGGFSKAGDWAWMLFPPRPGLRTALLWLSQGPDRDWPPGDGVEAFLRYANLQSVDSAIQAMRRRAPAARRPRFRADSSASYSEASVSVSAAAHGIWLSWFSLNYARPWTEEALMPARLLGLLRPEDRAALAEKRRRDEAAGRPVDEEIKQDFRIAVRAISLELIAGLFLSVLDSPEEARCPCRVLFQDGKAIPYAAAPQGNPDARADYGQFTVIAEATTTLSLRKSDIAQQWDRAHRHVDAIEGVPRIYCLMVSRLGLDDRRKWQAARLAEAGERLEEREGPAAEVRFLVFDIEDMAEIAHKLHELYCQEGAAKEALTADGLGLLLDELHAQAMEWLAGEDAFPEHWAGNTFVDMLGKYAAGKPITDREAA